MEREDCFIITYCWLMFVGRGGSEGTKGRKRVKRVNVVGLGGGGERGAVFRMAEGGARCR